jgi:hypothetical protein
MLVFKFETGGKNMSYFDFSKSILLKPFAKFYKRFSLTGEQSI